MKVSLPFLLVIVLMLSCKEASAPRENHTVEDQQTLAQAAFEENIEAIRAFYQAQCDENLSALSNMLSDTLRWSPPHYNGNKWLGKEDLLAALKAYHDNYDSIRFEEGLVLPDATAGAYWSGSVFPEGRPTIHPNVIRTYGTWKAIHKASGKEVGIKFYSNTTLTNEGQIVDYSDYFDLSSLSPAVLEME